MGVPEVCLDWQLAIAVAGTDSALNFDDLFACAHPLVVHLLLTLIEYTFVAALLDVVHVHLEGVFLAALLVRRQIVATWW